MILVASLLAGFSIHLSPYIVKAERGQILSLAVAKIVLKSLPIVNLKFIYNQVISKVKL